MTNDNGNDDEEIEIEGHERDDFNGKNKVVSKCFCRSDSQT
jgi:hypothetical protein